MKKDKDYTAGQIEDFANRKNYDIENFGGKTIGRAFMVISHPAQDICASFVLTGYKNKGAVYTCIYCDSKI
jgi:hypothetical protein